MFLALFENSKYIMLSPKLASFLYSFIDFFHLPGPPKLLTSFHISLKEHIKWFPNYVLCLLFELYFFSLSCGILPLSAASSTFHNLFVKVYIVGVFRQIKPHGQVGNDVDMGWVLLAQSNSPKKAMVKGSQAVVNIRVQRW